MSIMYTAQPPCMFPPMFSISARAATEPSTQYPALRESRGEDVPSCTVVWYVMRACALPSFSRWNTPTSVRTSDEPVERANAPFSITTFEKLEISSWTAGEMSPVKTGRMYGAGAGGDIVIGG